MSMERSQEHDCFHPKKLKILHQINRERRSPSPFVQVDQDGPLDFSKKSTLSSSSTCCTKEGTDLESSLPSYVHQNGHYGHYSDKFHLQGSENHGNGLISSPSISNGDHLQRASPLKNHEGTPKREESQCVHGSPPEDKPVLQISSHMNDGYGDHSLRDEKPRILQSSNWRVSSLFDTRNASENSIMSSVPPITTKIAPFIPEQIISVPPLLTSIPVLDNMPPFINGFFSQQSPTLGTNGERQSHRPVRPFKAFMDEILLSSNYSVQSSSNSFSNTLFPAKCNNVSKNRCASVSSNGSPETECRGNTVNTKSAGMNTDLDTKSDAHGSGDSNSSFSNSYSNCQQPDTSSGYNNRRKSRTMPEELKDAAYWERRRKNNEAAKRSRDARRQKEDAITLRAKQLHEENNQLRFYFAAMQKQIAFQETQNRALVEEHHKKDALIRQLQDELSKKRICSSCTSC